MYLRNPFFDLFLDGCTASAAVPEIKGQSYTTKLMEDGSMKIFVDLPGVSKEDLEVEVKDRVLKLKGVRKIGSVPETRELLWTVGKQYNLDTMKGELKEGVLTLTLQADKSPNTTKKLLIE